MFVPSIETATARVIDAIYLRLNAAGRLDVAFQPYHNTGVLVMNGRVSVNGERTAAAGDFVLFGHAGEHIGIEAIRTTCISWC